MRKSIKTTFQELFNGLLSPDKAREFLIRLHKRGEKESDIQAAVEIMRSHALSFEVPEYMRSKLIDNCGTGGDCSGTFNISTTVSFLLASLGYYVVKHGNRSITSKSGSADVLETLGVKTHLTSVQAIEMLEKTGFCFLFAPDFHPDLAPLMPIRRSIPHRTIFNLLGPLVNPASPSIQLVGLYSPKLVLPVARVLAKTGTKRALVVSSRWGLDEIHINGLSDAALVENREVTPLVIDPQKLGVIPCTKDEIMGGDALQNATILINILQGKGTRAHNDIVALNMAGALFAAKKVKTFQEGLALSYVTIKKGKGYEVLQKVRTISAQL